MRKKIALSLVLVILAGVLSFSFKDAFFDISRNLELFTNVFRQVNTYYVDETKPGELMKHGIDSMLMALDPYTNYISESEIEDYRFMTTGQYGGIGSLIRKRAERIIISEPYEGFAADKSGLMAGDVILEIDGKEIKGKNTDDVSKILKGQPGTSMKLLIERDGVKIEKQITREDIKIKAVPYFGLIADSVGYISLSSFTEECSKEVKNAFVELKEKHHIKALVLDLRGNPGGLLNESVNIANFFVEKGQEVVTTKGKVTEWIKSYKALNQPVDAQIPLVVLVNSGSASASEIVSGCIQDLDRGVIIGQRTYGKGLVQTTRNLSYNSKLKVTTAKYYVPSGRCIQSLDYAHRNEDGSVGKVPDSLISLFKTKSGRTVSDGGGIYPDIYMKPEKRSQLLRMLDTKFHLFDFAVAYRKTHDKIDDAKQFSLSEAEFDKFMKDLESKNLDYVTATEKTANELKTASQDEKYYEAIAGEFDKLHARVIDHKNQDLKNNYHEIKRQLEAEIVTKYYYQKGRIEFLLSSDPEIKKALEIFRNKNEFAGILNGTVKPMNPEEEKN